MEKILPGRLRETNLPIGILREGMDFDIFGIAKLPRYPVPQLVFHVSVKELLVDTEDGVMFS